MSDKIKIGGINPDWRCKQCGGSLGAVLGWADGEWEVFIPKTCDIPNVCKITVATVAQAMAVTQGFIK